MRKILLMMSISFVSGGCTCGIVESLRINVCRIAQYSDALADVQIVSWSANRTNARLTGYHPQCFTEVTIEVRDGLWGDIETGRYTVLVPGDIYANGDSEQINGQFAADGRATTGLMFLSRNNGHWVMPGQGYFWRSGEGLRNDAMYAEGIAYGRLVEAESFAGIDMCPDNEP